MIDRIIKEIRKDRKTDRKVESIRASFMKIMSKNKRKKCAEI